MKTRMIYVVVACSGYRTGDVRCVVAYGDERVAELAADQYASDDRKIHGGEGSTNYWVESIELKEPE